MKRYWCLGCSERFYTPENRDEHEENCWRGKKGDKPEASPYGEVDDL